MNKIAEKYIHQHNFTSVNEQNVKRTWYVLVITVITMAVEVIAGTIYGSMALLADGWHMGTHAAAFCITLFTYSYAKKHANSDKFSFGVGKVGVLGGYTSAIALAIVAIIMLVESLHRLWSPIEIQFNQSILVAIIGLVVNIASMFILGHEHHGHDHGDHKHHSHKHDDHKLHSHEHDDHERHSHEHDDHERHSHEHDDHKLHSHEHDDHERHSHEHDDHKLHSHEHDDHERHSHEHHSGNDHNLKAAYFHVLADALTSVLAICALLVGKFLGWYWLDPIMGIVGAVVITKWALGLMKQTSPILLDENIDEDYQLDIVNTIDDEQTKVTDIHIWRISADHYSASIAICTTTDASVESFKHSLNKFDKLSHLTIEVNYC
ncbi:cation diffusion facilitator family transporter [Shewanella frigidimarina]|uniref:cation diffusion facilitator family transporter n=1 Tax=Shewanella frigidimarina TaxID=56812 RepID=UPI000F4F75DF|nr:cation diffusion facilitator family transporter [Shewanella frigidimarina]RPA35521.1 cation diffusion facilitator family transporter [Shewanella frigidimarina]